MQQTASVCTAAGSTGGSARCCTMTWGVGWKGGQEGGEDGGGEDGGGEAGGGAPAGRGRPVRLQAHGGPGSEPATAAPGSARFLTRSAQGKGSKPRAHRHWLCPPSERTRRERSLRWSPGCAVPQRESGLGERASQPAAHGQSGQPLAS